MTRTALLGGETIGRGLLGGHRTRVENRILAGALLVAVCVWLTGHVVADEPLGALIGAGGLFAAVYALTWRTPSGSSAGAQFVAEWRWWSRRRHGLLSFAADSRFALPGVRQPQVRRRRPPRREVPDGLGRVRMLEYRPPAGGAVAVLHHLNPGGPPYLTAVLAVRGVEGGLLEEAEYDRRAAAFGRMLASLAKGTRLVTGLQLLNRVVPLDPSWHAAYAAGRMPADLPDQLRSSYKQLIQFTRAASEEHRSYLVIKVPVAAVAAPRSGPGESAEERWCRSVDDELSHTARLARQVGLGEPAALGPKRLAALVRSLQDPGYPVDQHGDVSWSDCWQSTVAARDHVLVNGRWATRVGHVSSTAVPPVPVGTRWLAPLVTDVSPPVIRTISVLLDLVPVREARQAAVRDATVDRGRIRERARRDQVDDGASEAQLTASAQRLRDLMYEQAAGVRWGMWVAVTAAGGPAVRKASRLLEDRAVDCGLASIDWCDTEHDLAHATVWPVWRGMAAA
jgi:hypothetical protein